MIKVQQKNYSPGYYDRMGHQYCHHCVQGKLMACLDRIPPNADEGSCEGCGMVLAQMPHTDLTMFVPVEMTDRNTYFE